MSEETSHVTDPSDDLPAPPPDEAGADAAAAPEPDAAAPEAAAPDVEREDAEPEAGPDAAARVAAGRAAREARRSGVVARRRRGAAVAGALALATVAALAALVLLRPATPVSRLPRHQPTVARAATSLVAASHAASASVQPTGSADAVAAYALPYPGAPSVAPVVFRSLSPKHRYVAITLDDGIPFDTRILKLFEDSGVRCTTFVLGEFARSRPDLMRRLKADGFEIANHTWDHKDLARLSAAGVRRELSTTQRQISEVTGNQAPYLRPPGGGYDDAVVREAASMGYRTVLWSRSLADTSRSATVAQLYKNATVGIKPGDIILCHWGRPYTYEALKLIVPELQRQGFELVTISELVADSGGPVALPRGK